MKRVLNLFVVSMMLTVLFLGCNKDDDTPSLDKKPIVNTQLLEVLKNKGFTVEEGALVMNEKALKTTALDLSGTKITDLSGLEVFPKLEAVNLSGNDLTGNFDFTKLPKNVVSVDLSNNNIYEYNGLVSVDFDNAKVEVLRKLKKLVLPYTARFNVEALPYFFKKSKDIDMQMQNKNGKAEAYTTLREIPDENLRNAIKKLFPSKFKGDKYDIFKPFSLEEKKGILNIGTLEDFQANADLTNVKLTSIEGIEYILNDPTWEGGFMAWMAPNQQYTANYIKLGQKCATIDMNHISTPMFDLSNAKSLHSLKMEYNNEIVKLDFLGLKTMGQRGVKSFAAWGAGDELTIAVCPKLEEIVLPKADELVFAIIHLIGLPALKTNIDLSIVKTFAYLGLGGLPNGLEIKYPTKYWYINTNGGKEFNETFKKGCYATMDIDESVYSRETTKAFLKREYSAMGDELSTNAYEEEDFDPEDEYSYFVPDWGDKAYILNGKKYPLYYWPANYE